MNKNAFRTWLDSKNLTIPGFAETIREKTGVKLSEGTVYKWASLGAHPRNVQRQVVMSVFNDCPLGGK